MGRKCFVGFVITSGRGSPFTKPQRFSKRGMGKQSTHRSWQGFEGTFGSVSQTGQQVGC